MVGTASLLTSGAIDVVVSSRSKSRDSKMRSLTDPPVVGSKSSTFSRPSVDSAAPYFSASATAWYQEMAREKAGMKGRTRVSEWRSARQYLLDLDIVDIWRESTVAEQRELLNGVFSKILAGPDGLALQVRGLDLGLEMSWHRGGVSPLMEVAGPGFEPGTP